MKYGLIKVRQWSKIIWYAALVLAMTGLAWPGAAQAAEQDSTPAGKSAWEITIVPYIWVLSVTGSVTAEGQETDINVTPEEVLSKVNGALMLDVDVRKGRFGGFINTFYAGIGDEESAQVLFENITFDTDIKMLLMAAAFYYRLGPFRLGQSQSQAHSPAVKVDPYVGGRYTDMDVTLDITTVNRLTGNTSFSSIEDKNSWTDPIIGARSTWDLFRHWTILASGDIGGFGVGSEFAWSATVLGGYRFNFSRHIGGNVLFGYRALYQDYSQGSGSDKFEYSATMHGPVVGLAIEF